MGRGKGRWEEGGEGDGREEGGGRERGRREGREESFQNFILQEGEMGVPSL